MRVVSAFCCLVFALLVFAAIRDSNANNDFACYGKVRCVPAASDGFPRPR